LFGIGDIDLGWQHHDDRHDLRRLIIHDSVTPAAAHPHLRSKVTAFLAAAI
jgi:hypothetical protein